MSAADDRIHSLEIPLIGCSLLVPSATVAEVTNPTKLHPVPGAPAWLVGVIGWRAQAVPVVSFEGMIGKAVTGAQPTSKIVVFYPIAGRRAGDFYAVLSASEPRPQSVGSNTVETEDPSHLPDSPLIATGVRIKGRSMMIPDFDALHAAFYPQSLNR
jgi:chemosensory pili system protein ChpC